MIEPGYKQELLLAIPCRIGEKIDLQQKLKLAVEAEKSFGEQGVYDLHWVTEQKGNIFRFVLYGTVKKTDYELVADSLRKKYQ